MALPGLFQKYAALLAYLKAYPPKPKHHGWEKVHHRAMGVNVYAEQYVNQPVPVGEEGNDEEVTQAELEASHWEGQAPHLALQRGRSCKHKDKRAGRKAKYVAEGPDDM